MTIAVTGATGHVGANLVRALLERGEQVRVLVRDDTRAIDGLDVERVRGDVLDPASLARAFEGAERVFHLAAYITLLDDWQRLEPTNVHGPANVVAACLQAGVGRLVHVSSIEALLHRECRRPVTEASPPPADILETAYGRSKALGMRVVREAAAGDLDAVIAYPTAVIGPWDFKPSHFGQMFIDFAAGRLPSLVGGGFDLVDVRDLVDGLLAVAERGRRGEAYLLSGEFMTVDQIAAALQEFTGAKRPRLNTPLWLAGFAALFTPPYYKLTGVRPRFTRMSIKMLSGDYRVCSAKAQDELGYAPRPAREGIRAAVDWFRGQGQIRVEPADRRCLRRTTK